MKIGPALHFKHPESTESDDTLQGILLIIFTRL